MKDKFLLSAEIPAVVRSLKNSVDDDYLLSYAEQLQECHYPADRETMLYLINKVIDRFIVFVESVDKSNIFYNEQLNRQNMIQLKKIKDILLGEHSPT